MCVRVCVCVCHRIQIVSHDNLSVCSTLWQRQSSSVQMVSCSRWFWQQQIRVSKMDGSTFNVPVQTQYVKSVQVDENGCNIQLSLTTIGDVKKRLEDLCGYRCQSQILYSSGYASSGLDSDGNETDSSDPEDFEFSDEQIVDECGFCLGEQQQAQEQGHTIRPNGLYLVIDPDRHYWHEHASLVRCYKEPVVAVIKAMPRLMRDQGFRAGPGRKRLLEFLQNCRKAVACLLERPAAHPARSLEELVAVKHFLGAVVIPIFKAVHIGAIGGPECEPAR